MALIAVVYAVAVRKTHKPIKNKKDTLYTLSNICHQKVGRRNVITRLNAVQARATPANIRRTAILCRKNKESINSDTATISGIPQSAHAYIYSIISYRLCLVSACNTAVKALY